MPNAYWKTVDGTVMRAECPECGQLSIRKNKDGAINSPANDPDERWYCFECKVRFDMPAWRSEDIDRDPTHGAARELLDADPDSLP